MLGINESLTNDAAIEMKNLSAEKEKKDAEIKEQVKKLFE